MRERQWRNGKPGPQGQCSWCGKMHRAGPDVTLRLYADEARCAVTGEVLEPREWRCEGCFPEALEAERLAEVEALVEADDDADEVDAWTVEDASGGCGPWQVWYNNKRVATFERRRRAMRHVAEARAAADTTTVETIEIAEHG